MLRAGKGGEGEMQETKRRSERTHNENRDQVVRLVTV